MDNSAIRPALPGTTPAPGPLGKKCVYSTRLPPTLTNLGTQEIRGSYFSKQTALHNKTISHIVSKLPFEIRESVSSVLTMALSSSDDIQQNLHVCNREISTLREELSKRITESNALKKNCSLYEERVRILQDNVESLKDEIDSRQKFTIKNKSAMSRLSSTNRMLIDALDALQSTTDAGAVAMVKSRSQRNLTGTNKGDERTRPGLLVPISKLKMSKSAELDKNEYEDAEQKGNMFQNDKLRESLLRVAREHYRSMKNSEILETKVAELKSTLQGQEQQNRKLKSELDEVRMLLHVDGSGDDMKIGMNEQLTMMNGKTKNNIFGLMDDKFQVTITRNMYLYINIYICDFS